MSEASELPADQPGPFTRFLWFCAGADSGLLARCPGSDWVKFQSIGGIVLATSLLAFVSASYALYTVFSPKDATAIEATTDPRTAVFAMLGGLVWSLVIFNIDRFIVSSAGKGDGTERITLGELFQSLPRLLMAIIIGVCISAPLEIRILKPEIDAQLELEQNAYLAKLNANAESLVQARKAELVGKLDKAQALLDQQSGYFEQRRLEINNQRRQLELEAEGKTAKGVPGRGPAWQDKKETLDKLEAELARDKNTFAAKEALVAADMKAWRKAADTLASELEKAKASNLKQSRHLDGLLKRIHISHQIGGLVPWAILLLLLAVETGPIFFKMMLVKSSYDYMLENQKRLAAARLGIEIDAHVFLSETQEELRVDTYHQVSASLAEEQRRLRSEAAVSEAVHERFREVAGQEIREGDGYKNYVS
ncbi:MAG TPA: DUF4407 domain-containing protein, partial [Polyangiales bacterium]|nr:DUF4407 domain-containing protein [Polyangiales bacterium]